jgi:Holliday junction resolvase RusA-like endonuclease
MTLTIDRPWGVQFGTAPVPVLAQFEVVGTPSPQGDKSAVMINGRPRLIEGKSRGQRERHRSWRGIVAVAARAHTYNTSTPLDGALTLVVEFRFAMPASRSKATRLRGTAPKYTAPDLDKLLRSLGDSLKEGGLIADDARFSNIVASKIEVTGWTGATVMICRSQVTS